MKQTDALKSTEQIVNDIWKLDLDAIKFKLMDSREGQGWSADEVDHYEREYKRFLVLLVKYPEKTIAPSKMVDAFWHAHILDTMKYADDCQRVFGYFLHHYPYFGMRGDEDEARLTEAFVTMKALHKEEFGDIQSGTCDVAAPAEYRIPASQGQVKMMDIPAYCGVALPRSAAPAYCGVAATDLKSEVSYCGIASEISLGEVAYCGVASVRYQPTPISSGKEAGYR